MEADLAAGVVGPCSYYDAVIIADEPVEIALW